MPSTVLDFGNSKKTDNSSAVKGQIGMDSKQGNSKMTDNISLLSRGK